MSTINLSKLQEEIEAALALEEKALAKEKIFDLLIPSYIELGRSLPLESRGDTLKQIALMKKNAQELYKNKFEGSGFEDIDVSIPTCPELGKLHLLSYSIDLIKNIMYSNKIQEVEAPCVDNEENNFDNLNIGKLHPARGMHDTFYLNSDRLLRTHTSNIWPHHLKSRQEAPFSVYHLGQAYRKDDDATHSPMFHQLEVLVVGKVTIANLKYHIRSFLDKFFGGSMTLRFRPSYFPFTEPSIEVDILWKRNKTESSKWMEVLGSGMVRQNILEKYGYSGCTGFAMGCGVERLLMLKYKVSNINDLYKNRFSFLENNSRKAGF